MTKDGILENNKKVMQQIDELYQHLIPPCDFCIFKGHPYKSGGCVDSDCLRTDYWGFVEKEEQ